MSRDIVVVTVKMSKAMHEAIKKVVEEGDYYSVSEFIRLAVKEKLKKEMMVKKKLEGVSIAKE